MLVTFPRYVGVAPGTTTIAYDQGGSMLGNYQWPPAGGGPGVPPYPTQAWLVPQATSANRVRMALPPNQAVTSMRELIVEVPDGQNQMGPVLNDKQYSSMLDYHAVRKGWIANRGGPSIYNLQGTYGQTVRFQGIGQSQEDIDAAEAEARSARKWSTIAIVVSALAAAATATVGVLGYLERRKSPRRRKRR